MPGWRDFMAAFDGERSLPNGRVENVTLSSWQRVLDLVDEVAVASRFKAHGTDHPMPERATELFASDLLLGTLNVLLEFDIRINFFPLDETSIDFDIDSRQLVNQGCLDVVAGFICQLGQAIGQPVIVSSEADDDDVLVRYDPGADRFEPGARTRVRS